MYVPYSGFLSRDKTFANCIKIDFCGENFREFVVTQCTTSTSTVSNCLKMDFRGENFRESPLKREIRESFLPRKKPAIQYRYKGRREESGGLRSTCCESHKSSFSSIKASQPPSVDRTQLSSGNPVWNTRHTHTCTHTHTHTHTCAHTHTHTHTHVHTHTYTHIHTPKKEIKLEKQRKMETALYMQFTPDTLSLVTWLFMRLRKLCDCPFD